MIDIYSTCSFRVSEGTMNSNNSILALKFRKYTLLIFAITLASLQSEFEKLAFANVDLLAWH